MLPVAGLKLVIVPAIMAVLLSLIPMEPVARAVLTMENRHAQRGRDSGACQNERTGLAIWPPGAVMLTTLLSAVTVPLMVLLRNAVGG